MSSYADNNTYETPQVSGHFDVRRQICCTLENPAGESKTDTRASGGSHRSQFCNALRLGSREKNTRFTEVSDNRRNLQPQTGERLVAQRQDNFSQRLNTPLDIIKPLAKISHVQFNVRVRNSENPLLSARLIEHQKPQLRDSHVNFVVGDGVALPGIYSVVPAGLFIPRLTT